MKVLLALKTMGGRWFAGRIWYAVRCKTGWLRRQMPCCEWPHRIRHELTGSFWDIASFQTEEHVTIQAEHILAGEFSYFSHSIVKSGFPPDWFANPFGKNFSDYHSKTHWSLINDFKQGDIKGCWELSRFAFAYPLVRAYHKTKNKKYINAFWQLAEDWSNKNPLNCGPNWKCGQEAVIRLFAWIFVWFATPEEQNGERRELLIHLIECTAERIDKNIGYAISQKNNHGISEAAGLWSSGLLLGNKQWQERGRDLLEKQVEELIYDDGGFCQHSVVYQRLVIDVCLWSIQLGRSNGFEFTNSFLTKIRLAGNFLESLMNPETGRLPNLGSNDGAYIFPVTDCDYLDFRPVVQAVSVILGGERIFNSGPWDEQWKWFGGKIRGYGQRRLMRHEHFPHAGLELLRNKESVLMLRCPGKYKHRPAQCDVLHADIWWKGVNLFRDGGSFSYNCEQPWQSYFKSNTAHNTVQFDDHAQMPLISRFLYGDWIQCKVQRDANQVTAAYIDYTGCSHQRCAESTIYGWRITDHVSGYRSCAVLRWRMNPEWDWRLTVDGCACEQVAVRITSKGLMQMALFEGWESLYYQEKHPVPVLEVKLMEEKEMLVTTDIAFIEKDKQEIA